MTHGHFQEFKKTKKSLRSDGCQGEMEINTGKSPETLELLK